MRHHPRVAAEGAHHGTINTNLGLPKDKPSQGIEVRPNMQTNDRIRVAVEKNPRKMTLTLARDLGVPEVEVIRAFPPDRVTELDVARWEELLRGLEAFGNVRVLVSNGATTIEVDGQFGGFSTAGEFFNVQTDTLDMHIRSKELAAVFAVEKPGHLDGIATRSFQFFDQAGAAALKVLLNFGGSITPERERRCSLSCGRSSSAKKLWDVW
jgi:putative hemin transport protein